MAQQQVTEQLFAGKGEMAMRMRSHDWSKTSLGAVETWSQSLKTAVRIMLTSSQPMWVWWGEELLNLYNDAYRPIMGGKHPAMFARPASEVWRRFGMKSDREQNPQCSTMRELTTNRCC